MYYVPAVLNREVWLLLVRIHYTLELTLDVVFTYLGTRKHNRV